MTEYVVTSPDGEEFVVTAPEGSTEADILEYAKSQFLSAPPKAEAEQGGPSAGIEALRAAEFGSRGFMDSAAETAGALPELVSAGMRKAGLPSPESGYYPETIKSGMESFGKTISAPFNYLLDGSFGPDTPQSTMDRSAYGAGRGVADAGSFMVPGVAAAKLAKAGGLTGRVGATVAAQPAMQAAAGAVGGGVEQASGSGGLGLAASLAVPSAAGLTRKAITPFASQLTRNEQRLASKAMEHNIPLTPGQQTGSPSLQRTEQMFAQMPLTEKIQGDIYDAQRKAFNKAVLLKAGVNGDEVYPEIIEGAFTSIGKRLDDLASQTTVNVDDKLLSDINLVKSEHAKYFGVDASTRFKQIARKLNDLNIAKQSGGTNIEVPGESYQKTTSFIKRKMRSTVDPDEKDGLGRLVEALDDAAERSMGKSNRKAWKQARGDYKNLLVIDKASGSNQANIAAGDMPYAGLITATKGMDKSGFGRGRGDLNELSRVGAFLGSQRVPDPGSAGMITSMAAPTVGLGAMAAGVDPAAVLPMVGGVFAGPKLMQMGYQNPTIQRYLTNQMLPKSGNLPGMIGKVGIAEQLGDIKQDPYLLRTK